MLSKFRTLIDSLFIEGSNTSPEDSKHARQLAMAALMVEVAESDYVDSQEEHDAILKVVKQSFDLDADEAKELVDMARQEHAESTDYFQFTRLINQNYSASERIELIESLWKVAFADKILDKHEEHVIRRIADLIHVSHSDFMATKLKVQSNNS